MTATSPHPQTPARITPGKPRSYVLPEPTEEDRQAALSAFFGAMKRTNAERLEAANAARPALAELCDVMRNKTGQSHIVRSLLWSLYNGQTTSLIELVSLDWKIRQALCAVLLAFGFEDVADPSLAFFYDALKKAITDAGLWDWFTAAGESEVAA